MGSAKAIMQRLEPERRNMCHEGLWTNWRELGCSFPGEETVKFQEYSSNEQSTRNQKLVTMNNCESSMRDYGIGA